MFTLSQHPIACLCIKISPILKVKFRIIQLSFLILVLFTAPQVEAQPICDWGSKLIKETEAGADDLFQKHLQGDEFTVIGKIMDVKIGKNSLLEFYTSSCNNRVLITFLCKNNSLNSNFRVREQVKFIGKCTSMKKGVLKNTGQQFVWFFFDNVDVWPKK